MMFKHRISRHRISRHRQPSLRCRSLIILMGMLAMVFSGCQAASPRVDSALTAGGQGEGVHTAEVPTPVSFWHTAGSAYAGVTLHGITEDSPPSRYIRDLLAPAFEAETGIHIDLVIGDNSTVEEAITAADDSYDFAYIEQDVIYDYLDDARLTDLSQMLAANPHLVAPDFDPADFTDFVNEFRDPASGALYGVPIEAFIKAYAYRKDLFEDPAIKAAFETRYNYPLAPAVTVEQYQDIAEFFTAYGVEQGLDLWGSSLQAKIGHDASFYEFFETIAPSFGIYNWGIDLTTNRATLANGGTLDSDKAKAALTFWLGLQPFAPPEATDSTWSDVAQAFGAGRIAQGWLYGEYIANLATDPTNSQVVGKLGVALPPTTAGVIEDAIVGAGYLGYYDGAAFGIPINSRQKEATLLWLQYLGQPSVQPRWAVQTSRIVHLSTFDDPLVESQDRRLNGYYTLMKREGNLFAGAPPVPYHADARAVMAPYIHAAIQGTLTPEQALDQAAVAVDELLIRLGYAE